MTFHCLKWELGVVTSAVSSYQLQFGILGLENHQIYFKTDWFYAAFS